MNNEYWKLKNEKYKAKTLPLSWQGFRFGGVGEIRTLARFLDAYSLSRGAPSASWVPLRIETVCRKEERGGESGIRTHGPLPGHRFSRPAP